VDTHTELQPWERAARDQKIREQHSQGVKASIIARWHKLTPQRVRQILRAADAACVDLKT
jgi:hypothetical protein